MASKRYKFYVNTSFCFLCSDKILNDNQTNSDVNSFSLKCIFQYLNIKLNEIKTLSTKPIELLNKTDVRVSLCDDCQETFKEISNLYTTLEVIKMKLNYKFETIQKAIKSTFDAEAQNQMEETTEKMFLRHFNLAKELQKEILDKCNLKMPNYQPRVNLEKVKKFTKKAAIIDETLGTPKYETTSEVIDSTVSIDEVLSMDFTFQPLKIEHTDNDDLNSELDALETCIEHDLKVAPEVYKMKSPSPSGLEDSIENFKEKKVKDQMKVPTFSRNSSTGKYDCPVCNQPFKTLFIVRRHYEGLHLQKRFKCNICNVSKFSRPERLKIHKKTCQVRDALIKVYYTKNCNTGMYHCKKCDKKCKAIWGVRMHYEAVHLNVKDFILKKTAKINKTLPEFKTTSGVNISTASSADEQGHLKDETQVPTFSRNLFTGKYDCPACNRPFNLRSNLRRHYECVHLRKRFKCDICNVFDFSQLARLNIHKKTCKGEGNNKVKKTLMNVYYTKNPTTGMYHCEKCDKQFMTKGGMHEHCNSVHLKIRHKCESCNIAVFRTTASLIRHRKTCRETLDQRLTKIKERSQYKFVCKLCKNRFVSKRSLECHVFLIHTKVNGYPCEVCGKKFTHPHYLKVHKEGVHLGKLFSCRFCSAKFTSYYKRRFHEEKCTLKSKVKSEPAQ